MQDFIVFPLSTLIKKKVLLNSNGNVTDIYNIVLNVKYMNLHNVPSNTMVPFCEFFFFYFIFFGEF